jgi:hypothetical protein
MSIAAAPKKIRWGLNLANTLWIPFADNPVSWVEPGVGSEWGQGPSGSRDAWLADEEPRLAFDWRWIPGVDTRDPLATGWDGAAGVQAWLSSARAMEPFAFHGDARNLLANPSLAADANGNGVADEWTNWVSSGVAATYTVATGQRISITSSTAAGDGAVVYQTSLAGAVPGQPYRLRVTAARSISTVQPGLIYSYRLASGTFTSQIAVSLAGSLGGFVNDVSLGVAPADAVSVYIQLRAVTQSAGATGAVEFWNAMAYAGATATPAYVGDSSILCQLVEPLRGQPEPDEDGLRRMRTTIAGPVGSTFDGY